ncbi:MAG: hypothetical protein KIT40_00210 [Nitrospira sp.]|nr:hypothetical protein [Nitrospira sp.]
MPDYRSPSDFFCLIVECLGKRRLAPLLALITGSLLLFLAFPKASLADVRVVTATGEHRMTERETRIDAIRLATEQAKQQALEQVASYLESVTVVRNLDVTQDELRSYTAGMVLVLDQQVDTALDGEVVVIRVTLKAQVDSDEAAQAIIAMKQNEDVRQELVALKDDVESLHQQLKDANQALARASSPEQARQLNQRRTDLLNHAESDAMVAQAWTDWLLIAPFAHPYPSAGVAQVQALLGIAARLNPNNPHLAIAQQTVGANVPPAPPQPRQPPVPHTVPFLPGYYVVPKDPTLPGTTPPTDSKQLSSVYQLNPLLPNPSGQPPQSGNSTTIIQVHPRPGTSPSVSDRSMMPTYRQIPAPNSQANHPTLHTYRAGGSTSSAPTPASPDQATRGGPPLVHQTPPVSPFESVPQRGSTNNQGEK